MDETRPAGKKRSKKLECSEPIVVRRGSATVKIYQQVNRRQPLWAVVYYIGKKRIRRNRANLADAKRVAEQAANKLSNGQLDVLALSSADAQNYTLAQRELQSIGLPLYTAIEDYVRAIKMLGDVPLAEAVRMYLSHYGGVKPKNTKEIVAEFLQACLDDETDKRSVDELRRNLRWFTDTFAGPITEIKEEQINVWLRDMKKIRGCKKSDPPVKVSPRTRNNRRESVVSLFLFAKTKGYLPRELTTEAELAKTVREIPKAIGTFTPDEMGKLLIATPSSLRPFLVLGGYAGIRHIEILRMDWGMLRWNSHNIVLPADITKNRRRRVVPMLPALRAWLTPFRSYEGAVCGKKDQAKCKAVAAAHSIPWTHNVLRHSFASYRVAATSNEAQTAREMGTSVGLIHSNYEDVKTPQEAADWWSSTPAPLAQVA